MAITLTALLDYCNDLLKPDLFEDYCPNGLQVEGAAQVEKVVTGVTASQALLEAAIDEGAQAVLVHHGYFWKGDQLQIRGMLKRRLKLLLDNDISLIAYHLPLDAQPEFGNNVRLAQVLGFDITGGMEPGNDLSVGLVGKLKQALDADTLASHIEHRLGRTPLHIAGKRGVIGSIAWCTGAAQGFIKQAAALGVDAYLTGEISEPTVHFAREMGIHFYAAGHHATERYGIQALGDKLATELGVPHRFIDIDNPV